MSPAIPSIAPILAVLAGAEAERNLRMTTRSITTTWRGLTVSADVYSEPDPLSSSGDLLYDVDGLWIEDIHATPAEVLILEAYDAEIREAILEAAK